MEGKSGPRNGFEMRADNNRMGINWGKRDHPMYHKIQSGFWVVKEGGTWEAVMALARADSALSTGGCKATRCERR